MKKNLIYSTAIGFTAFLSITFFACNKSTINRSSVNANNENIKQTRDASTVNFNDVTATISNNIVSFNSIEDYKRIFEVENYDDLLDFANEVNSTSNFTSFYSKLDPKFLDENNNGKDQYEFIGKLLNNNSIIRLGEFTLLIDFDNEKVFAKTDGTESELISAKNGNAIEGIHQYSIYDDVAEELSLKKTRGLFCHDSWAGNPANGGSMLLSTISTQNMPVGFDNFGNTIYGNVDMQEVLNVCNKYWAAGIYFELNGRVIITPAGNPLATAPFAYTVQYTWKRRCGTSGGNTHSFSFANASSDKKICYWNVRALTKYSLTTTASSSVSSIPGQTVVITTNQ
jgi:hypothetical protein